MTVYAPGAPTATLAANTFTGLQTAPDFKASGLTGATAASRYVGATASGAPASGTFAVGDFVIDQAGLVWVCTAAGTPGTWAAAGAVASVFGRTGAVVAGNADYRAVAAAGLTGATAAGRLVGATASGAPASGTFAVGDLVIDQAGKLWVCTAAGTPGTWAQIGGSAGAVTQIARKTQADSISGTIKFTTIPQTYNILWLVWSVRSTTAAATDNTVIRANNDSSANYIDEAVIGTTTTASAAQHTGSGGLVIADAEPANTATASFFGVGELLIPDYTSTGKFKPALMRGYDPQGQVATMAGGQFKTLSAITELDILNGLDWASPSSWTLYGLT